MNLITTIMKYNVITTTKETKVGQFNRFKDCVNFIDELEAQDKGDNQFEASFYSILNTKTNKKLISL